MLSLNTLGPINKSIKKQIACTNVQRLAGFHMGGGEGRGALGSPPQDLSKCAVVLNASDGNLGEVRLAAKTPPDLIPGQLIRAPPVS